MLKEVKREVENGQSLMGMISIAVDPNHFKILERLISAKTLVKASGASITQGEMELFLLNVISWSMSAEVNEHSETIRYADALEKGIERFLASVHAMEYGGESLKSSLVEYFKTLRTRGKPEISEDVSSGPEEDVSCCPEGVKLRFFDFGHGTQTLVKGMACALQSGHTSDSRQTLVNWLVAQCSEIACEGGLVGEEGIEFVKTTYGKKFGKLFEILVDEKNISGPLSV